MPLDIRSIGLIAIWCEQFELNVRSMLLLSVCQMETDPISSAYRFYNIQWEWDLLWLVVGQCQCPCPTNTNNRDYELFCFLSTSLEAGEFRLAFHFLLSLQAKCRHTNCSAALWTQFGWVRNRRCKSMQQSLNTNENKCDQHPNSLCVPRMFRQHRECVCVFARIKANIVCNALCEIKRLIIN